MSDLVLFRAFKIVKELIHDKGVVYDAANRPVNLKDPEKLKTVSVIFALSCYLHFWGFHWRYDLEIETTAL